jgi:outer membrane protein OmpA-like peptidoglycan-associated protein
MMSRNRLASSIAAGVIAAVCGMTAGHAQEGAMFGVGPDRVCNTLSDKESQPVLQKQADLAVFTNQTYDCPEAVLEPIAQIAPAAPPAPVEALPASGVIYFDLDRADLNGEGAASLGSIIGEIRGRELGGITVAGHTDTSGSAEHNMGLSQRRANTVAAELVKAGVPATIISAVGYGQTDLAVPTDDGVVLAANRRVVVDFAQ